MSGFEIAGLVLGGVPLIISALENYQKVVEVGSTWKYFKLKVRDLVKELKTEEVILRNTCEILLGGITTPSQTSEMIKYPFGPLWHSQDICDRISMRLGKSLDAFKSMLELMKEAMDELRDELSKLESSSTLSLTRLSFAVNRSKFDKLIDTLRKHNRRLSELAAQSKYLEPIRRDSSQRQLVELARGLAKSVFDALQYTLTCRCSVPHGINLQLTAFPAHIMMGGDEELAVKSMDFQLPLAFDPDNVDSTGTPWLWEDVRLQLTDEDIIPVSSAAATVQTSELHKRIVKKTHFAVPIRIISRKPNRHSSGVHRAVQSTLVPSMAIGIPGRVSGPKKQSLFVNDLCSAIAKGHGQRDLLCYGYISDKTITNGPELSVHPVRDYPKGSWSVLSLKDVLEDRGTTLPRLRFRHKVKLSYLFALSLLQLSCSPWIPKLLTSRDILFLKKDGKDLYESAYIAHRLPNSLPNQPLAGEDRTSPLIPNKQLFSLGLLLIELALETPLDRLRDSPNGQDISQFSSPEADWVVAVSALSELRNGMGVSTNYFKSAKACIQDEFLHENTDLNDKLFRQEVYRKVVAPLWDDLPSLQN